MSEQELYNVIEIWFKHLLWSAKDHLVHQKGTSITGETEGKMKLLTLIRRNKLKV